MRNKTINYLFCFIFTNCISQSIKIIVEVEPSCMTIAVLKKLGLVFTQG